MALAHQKLAEQPGATDKSKHLSEARRLYSLAAKQIDEPGGLPKSWLAKHIRAFRAAADKLIEQQ